MASAEVVKITSADGTDSDSDVDIDIESDESEKNPNKDCVYDVLVASATRVNTHDRVAEDKVISDNSASQKFGTDKEGSDPIVGNFPRENQTSSESETQDTGSSPIDTDTVLDRRKGTDSFNDENQASILPHSSSSLPQSSRNSTGSISPGSNENEVPDIMYKDSDRHTDLPLASNQSSETGQEHQLEDPDVMLPKADNEDEDNDGQRNTEPVEEARPNGRV